MYQIFRNRIAAGGFKLADIQQRAKKLYALGDLTEEQLDELMALAQQNATAEAERPEMLDMLRNLAERVSAMEKKLTGQEDTESEQADYEAWVAWDGVSNKYQEGTIVSHGDKLWKSVFTGQNVWEPGTAGTESLWVEYIEEERENA